MERIKTREERALPRSSWSDSEFASGIFININGSSTNIFCYSEKCSKTILDIRLNIKYGLRVWDGKGYRSDNIEKEFQWLLLIMVSQISIHT